MSVREFKSVKFQIRAEYDRIKDLTADKFTLAEILFIQQINDSEKSLERIREIVKRILQ